MYFIRNSLVFWAVLLYFSIPIYLSLYLSNKEVNHGLLFFGVLFLRNEALYLNCPLFLIRESIKSIDIE